MSLLILGGARSGKSHYAETLAAKYDNVYYVATAVPVDEETRSRIAIHQSQRPAHWRTVEAPVKLAQAIEGLNDTSSCVLIDCLTFWLNNCLYESDKSWDEQKSNFINCLSNYEGSLIMVSNETGMGIVPMGKQTRQFVDEVGWLHQQVARLSDTVVLMIAGLPHPLKGTLPGK